MDVSLEVKPGYVMGENGKLYRNGPWLEPRPGETIGEAARRAFVERWGKGTGTGIGFLTLEHSCGHKRRYKFLKGSGSALKEREQGECGTCMGKRMAAERGWVKLRTPTGSQYALLMGHLSRIRFFDAMGKLKFVGDDAKRARLDAVIERMKLIKDSQFWTDIGGLGVGECLKMGEEYGLETPKEQSYSSGTPRGDADGKDFKGRGA